MYRRYPARHRNVRPVIPELRRGVAVATATALAVATAAGLAGFVIGDVPRASANGVSLAAGDVLADIGLGKITHYTTSGTLVDTLDTTSGTDEGDGMCFDASQNLYATQGFTADTVSEFSSSGNLLAANFGSGYDGHPESCTVDSQGDIYVGQPDGLHQVLKFDPSGHLLASYSPAIENRGTDWIDLASDQCTLYYTSEGSSIKRFNVCTNVQVPDLATGLPAPCFELRLRPNGDVMVACQSEVARLDSSGKVLQTYPLPGSPFLFAMNLDPDNTTFWTADYFGGTIFHVDIASGTVLHTISSRPNTVLGGIAVVGEINVATQCSPPLNLVGNPGFESPVLAPSALPAPLSLSNWESIGSGGTNPDRTTMSPHCGLYSGEVQNGYWVQDLPLASDPNAPNRVFDPTSPFEFAFWFNPSRLGNAVSLVQNWDRGVGKYTNLISMSLTAVVGGGFQTQVVVQNKSLNRSPVVPANTWSQFIATADGQGNPVHVTIDGVSLSQGTLGRSTAGQRVTVLMGATGGPNSVGPTDVKYDDVYLGPPISPVHVTTNMLPDGTVFTPYQSDIFLAAAGGFPPYTWTTSLGPSPCAGLTINPNTGQMTGVAGVAGTCDFAVSVSDSSIPPNIATAELSLTIHPSQQATTWPVVGSGADEVKTPHVGFVLVGDWWCPLLGSNVAGTICASPKSYKCPKEYASCLAETSGFLGALNSLVQTDYGASSLYRQQLSLYYCFPTLDCGNQAVSLSLYNNQSFFYGPISPAAAATPGSVLNPVASNFGITSQSDASDTVFIFLYAPTFACSAGSANGQTQSSPGVYGFTFAAIYLEDYSHYCNGPQGNTPGGDLNQQSRNAITPYQFSTFAVSHELDEALTAPGNSVQDFLRGFPVDLGHGNLGQLADPCNTRTFDGNHVGPSLYPYWNFARDQFGTVVAAFVQFSDGSCYPDVSTGVPPG